MRNRGIIVIFLLPLVLSGCSLFPPPGGDGLPSGGAVLYSEDFGSGAESRWPIVDVVAAKSWIENGQYHLLRKEGQSFSWAHDKGLQQFWNFRYDADLSQVGGPDNNGYGLVFRATDRGFYEFILSGTGYVRLLKLLDNETSVLLPWTKCPAVRTGEASNHVAIVCDGSQFSFYVNGEHVTIASDTSFAIGKVGVIVRDFGEPNVHITFDNLVVRELN